ncbi:MAG TPA: hypothetical protein VFS61_03930 [Anaerolineales bacterium]|nr:hypothetical protein [Anaerolineales bacterium]
MLKEQAGISIELPPQANGIYLEHQIREIIREVDQSLNRSSLDQFTGSFINALWKTLNDVIHHLERLPEGVFKDMIEVIGGLREARSELRLASFLFDVEEINPVHRLIMRNRAMLRGRQRMQKTLLVWPGDAPRGQDDHMPVGKTLRV